MRGRGERGFSLIELMVVILIIGILGSFAAIKLLGRAEEAKRTKALNDIKVLEEAVEMFYMKNSRLPESLEEIAPELKGEEVPLDPWGNEYVYVVKGRRQYDIICYGADGEEGGEGLDADLNRKTVRQSQRKSRRGRR